MMKSWLSLSLLGALLSTASGCIVVPRHHPGYHPAAVVVPVCPPAHHWDGHACRHNGNGHYR